MRSVRAGPFHSPAGLAAFIVLAIVIASGTSNSRYRSLVKFTFKILPGSLISNVSRWLLLIHSISCPDDPSKVLEDGSWYRGKSDLRSLHQTAALPGDYGPG